MHALDVLRDPERCGDEPMCCPQPAKGAARSASTTVQDTIGNACDRTRGFSNPG